MAILVRVADGQPTSPPRFPCRAPGLLYVIQNQWLVENPQVCRETAAVHFLQHWHPICSDKLYPEWVRPDVLVWRRQPFDLPQLAHSGDPVIAADFILRTPP